MCGPTLHSSASVPEAPPSRGPGPVWAAEGRPVACLTELCPHGHRGRREGAGGGEAPGDCSPLRGAAPPHPGFCSPPGLRPRAWGHRPAAPVFLMPQPGPPSVDEKGPHTMPEKLRGGLRVDLRDSDTCSDHTGEPEHTCSRQGAGDSESSRPPGLQRPRGGPVFACRVTPCFHSPGPLGAGPPLQSPSLSPRRPDSTCVCCGCWPSTVLGPPA